MGVAVSITRLDLTASELRKAASGEKNSAAARRILALALVLDGLDRKTAAETCGMDRQTLRDWVHRYNATDFRLRVVLEDGASADHRVLRKMTGYGATRTFVQLTKVCLIPRAELYCFKGLGIGMFFAWRAIKLARQYFYASGRLKGDWLLTGFTSGEIECFASCVGNVPR
jgi:hypothetical protein